MKHVCLVKFGISASNCVRFILAVAVNLNILHHS